MAGNSAEPGRSVTSKIVAILQAFTNGGMHSLTEIARLTELPVSTVHRLASELAVNGVLERTEDARYRVGLPLRKIGSRVSHAPSPYEWARRAMEDLSRSVNADVRFGVLEYRDVAYTEAVVGRHSTSLLAGAAALPAHATAMGKALLAFSPHATVDRVIAQGLKQYTPYTLTCPDRLRRALQETRLRQVALARSEMRLGACAVAAPVFDRTGKVFAAIEIALRDPRDELPLIQPALLVAARSLSRELGAKQHPDRHVKNGWPRRIGGHMDGSTRHTTRINHELRLPTDPLSAVTLRGAV
jgi:IclR family acetate operon transcriptional repressor